MNSTRDEQIAALNEISDYVERLVKNIPVLAEELRGEKKADTAEFLQQVVQGLGWVIEVTNKIMPLLNENEEYLSKTEMNEAILSLNEALGANDFDKISEALEKPIKNFLNELLTAAMQFK